jgi:FkbM family methyltransferase
VSDIEPSTSLTVVPGPQPLRARLLHSPLRKLLPRRIRRGLVSLGEHPGTWRLVADIRSFREFRRLENPPRRLRGPEATVTVRFRALAPASVELRPHTEDDGLARDVFFASFHLPPAGVDRRELRRIWDLGANVGLTMAHMATLFPHAHITGVELDADNAALCERNVSHWPDRCEVIPAGVWTRTGTVGYERPPGRVQSFHVVDDGGATRAPAISLNALLERSGRPIIDYVKMDIEGAERAVLNENAEWASHVRSIKVELHDGYSIPECLADLERLGFTAAPIPRHHAGVAGVRADLTQLGKATTGRARPATARRSGGAP